jgi:hypothetical protein
MTDHRKEIPAWAFINAQIAQLAVHTEDFRRCVRRVEEQYGLHSGALNNFISPAYLASLLYCLIVVPKEVWVLSENHDIYSKIDKAWLLTVFAIDKADEQFGTHPVYYLLRHLRNAVAHVHFSVEDDGRFVFWDQKSKDSSPYFRASISSEALGEFLSKVGALMANLRVA